MRVMRIARGYLSRNYLMFSLLDIRPPCGQLIGRTVPLLRVMRIMRIARGYLTQHYLVFSMVGHSASDIRPLDGCPGQVPPRVHQVPPVH